MHVEGHAPNRRFGDPIAGEQRVEPGITIGMDDAAKIPSSGATVDALPCGRVISKTAPPAGTGKTAARREQRSIVLLLPVPVAGVSS